MKIKLLIDKNDFDIVHDYLLKKKLTPIFLPNLSQFQKMKAYGLVKRMSKFNGGVQQFKKEYQQYIENTYYIFKKPLVNLEGTVK